METIRVYYRDGHTHLMDVDKYVGETFKGFEYRSTLHCALGDIKYSSYLSYNRIMKVEVIRENNRPLEIIDKEPAEGDILYDYRNDRDIVVITIYHNSGMALCEIIEYDTDQDGEIITQDSYYDNFSIEDLKKLKVICA